MQNMKSQYMANNDDYFTEKVWVRYNAPIPFIVMIVTCIFLFNLTGKTLAQNISKYYTSSIQDKGTIYYIYPQSGFKNKKRKSEFTYDLTYMSNSDSVRINYSYFDKSSALIDSISFFAPDKSVITSKAHKIFIEEKKQRWQYRYACAFLFPDLKKIFDQKEPPTIILYTRQGASPLYINKKSWKNQSAIIAKIFELFMLNASK